MTGASKYKFLIDECLSPDLATEARGRGFSESTHVVWLGRSGEKDWSLIETVVKDDWTFVTTNTEDWIEEHGAVEIHAGLICLNGARDADSQMELFLAALELASARSDLINQVMELTLEKDQIVREIFELPNAGGQKRTPKPRVGTRRPGKALLKKWKSKPAKKKS